MENEWSDVESALEAGLKAAVEGYSLGGLTDAEKVVPSLPPEVRESMARWFATTESGFPTTRIGQLWAMAQGWDAAVDGIVALQARFRTQAELIRSI